MKRFAWQIQAELFYLFTQALSRYVEEFIIAHSTDWYWVHRRWKRAGEPLA